mmetsp:Transcript_26690/g.30534  ORF Transcript_26690/g.30534 Transcript_26690/m.30534 type:complete len:184 (-) Transcript_26690:858-1409(-)
MASTIRKINMLKISLSKRLATSGGAVETLSDEDVESLKDMLQQLESLEVNLEVLTKTLIGTIVSKFKKHEVLGPTAKALVKKWKAIAKGEVSNKKPPPPAEAAAAAEDSLKSSSRIFLLTGRLQPIKELQTIVNQDLTVIYDKLEYQANEAVLALLKEESRSLSSSSSSSLSPFLVPIIVDLS